MMKRILLSFLVLTSAAMGREIVADLAAVLNQPAAVAEAAFGKPQAKSEEGGDWSKGKWKWHLSFDQGRSAAARVPSIPEGQGFKSLEEAAQAFGFTAKNGWTTKPLLPGPNRIEQVELENEKKGLTVTLKATKGDKPSTWTELNFVAPLERSSDPFSPRESSH